MIGNSVSLGQQALLQPIDSPMNTRRMRSVGGLGSGGLVLLCAGLALSGCSSGKVPEGRDAQTEVLDSRRQLNERQIALEQVVDEAGSGQRDPKSVRESMKQLIWKASAPEQLRVRALNLLLEDQSPEAQADTRNLMRLRMPTEPSWVMIGAMCDACVQRAAQPEWKELTAALVRSYARRVPLPTDDQRPERRALEALHPGQSVELTAFNTFLKPEEHGATTKVADWVTKAREAAWELLSRLDPDGSKRTGFLASTDSKDPSVRVLERCAKDLGVVPVTGSELTWLERLAAENNPANQAWWAQASAAARSLTPEQRQGLELRHIESVRWASTSRPQWLQSGRSELLSELTQRLSGRRAWRKTEGLANDQQISRELLTERQNELVWGDLITIAAIDEALHAPGVSDELFAQSDADRADTSAEYGGALGSGDMLGRSSPFLAKGFSPRASQRLNDRTFVAPSELFSGSDRALAHYHFHVQTDSNAAYAGPGMGDLEYAQNHGRNCLVFTSVRAGVLNADYYQRNGAAIDLGELKR